MAISDTRPKESYLRGGKTVFPFNIKQSTITDPMTKKTRTQYEYDEAEVEGEVTKAKLIEAQLLVHYSLSDQIALLANKGDGNVEHQKELADFQAVRVAVKETASSVMEPVEKPIIGR